MRKIAIFGKGGIGKSTFSANLAAVYARRGKRVLLVGCDPKHDTTLAFTEGIQIRTAVEHSAFMDSRGQDASGIVVKGRLGVDCVEAGGPEPGIGCAGRGISRMIELLEEAGTLRADRYDVALFDVLGDVVCGGFAAPLREGMADKVVVVSSEELMSLYAANNIARAVRNYAANGSALAGLVANLRDPDADRGTVERFAALLGTRVLCWLGRDAAVRKAEYLRTTVVESAPGSDFAKKVEALADELFSDAPLKVPNPLSDERFQALSRASFRADRAESETRRPSDAPEPAPARAAEKAAAGESLRERVEEAHARLEKALAAVPPGSYEAGSLAEQWGASDQWRMFFCDREARRNARAGLELQARVLHVWHQDLECSYASPDWSAEGPNYFNFPWNRSAAGRRRGGPEEPQGRGEGPGVQMPTPLMTNLRDQDVIGGGEAKLRGALESWMRRGDDVDAVVVNSTCVPTVIGDDVPKVLGALKGMPDVPLVHNNPASNQFVDVGRVLLERVRSEPGYGRAPKTPRSVNLVGFPAGPARSELEGLLGKAGVQVNACAMPAMDLGLARRLPCAQAQVFLPNAAYEQAYSEIFSLPGIAGHSFAPPFGVEGTRVWLRAVCGLFGLEKKADKVFAAAFAEHEDAWERLRAQALGRTLAFVADRERLPRLTDPRLLWGVPILRVLREMGFQVEILLFGDKGRGAVKGFKTPGELERLLSRGDYDAVYSEYFFDDRLVRAGKAQFSLSPFEPGLRGAVATLERLLTVCRWDFYRRYADSFRGEAA